MEHYHDTVPGWAAFRDLYFRAVAEAPLVGAHFVEVGSWLGKSAVLMAVEIERSEKDIQFECVDPWIVPENSRGKPYSEDGRFFERFLENIAPVAHRIGVLRMTSLEAARRYTPESLDLVMVDAAHDYESVRADILAWRPLIRPGGILAGDDFEFDGVRRAVTELLPDHEVHETPFINSRGRARYWTQRC